MVKVTINSKSYTGKTNSAGKFSILHPNDGLAYDNTSHNIKIEVVSSDYSWATTSSNDIIFSRTFYG